MLLFLFFFGANNPSTYTHIYSYTHKKITERVTDEDRASDSEVAARVAFLEGDGQPVDAPFGRL